MIATALAAEWAEYEARNRRAAVEYDRRPSIVAEILFNTMPAALYAWFPDLIGRLDGGDRFRLRTFA